MGDCTVIKRVVVSRHTTTVSGVCFEACEIHRAAGCSINHGYVVTDGERRFFVKTNRTDRYNMFENEAKGLSALADADAIQVPAPICYDRTGQHAYLALEYLLLQRPDDGTRGVLCKQLAAQHRVLAMDFG